MRLSVQSQPSTTTIRATRPIRQILTRGILWPAWALLGLLTLVFASGISVSPWLQYAPFVVSIILFGLPHGALDHLVVFRVRRERVRVKPMMGFISGYLILVGLYLGLWFVVPGLAFVFFIAMTWFHWGQGDLHTLLTLSPTQYLESKSRRAMVLFIRGGFPMLVPFLAFPAVYQAEVQHLVQLFDQTAVHQLEWAFTPAVQWSLGGVFAGVVLISLRLNFQSAWSRGDLSAWSIDAIECLLLAIFFSTVPPVLAIGVYFCLWHATRHIARLMLIDPVAAQALRTQRLLPALIRFFRDAWPMTSGALLILGGLFYFIPDATATLRDSVAVYLALIAALTFPHIVTVSWMDWQQGVWKLSLNPWHRRYEDLHRKRHGSRPIPASAEAQHG